MKRVYRSDTDKVFAGVLGGLGEYFEIDPTILRLVYILITILTGVVPAIIGYVIAYLVVPPRPRYMATDATYTEAPKKDMPKDEPNVASSATHRGGEKEESKKDPGAPVM